MFIERPSPSTGTEGSATKTKTLGAISCQQESPQWWHHSSINEKIALFAIKPAQYLRNKWLDLLLDSGITLIAMDVSFNRPSQGKACSRRRHVLLVPTCSVSLGLLRPCGNLVRRHALFGLKRAPKPDRGACVDRPETAMVPRLGLFFCQDRQ